MIYTSNSEVQTFKDCYRKWWLMYILKLEAKHDDATGPLWIGTMVHKGVEGHDRAIMAGEADPAAAGMRSLSSTIAAAMAEGRLFDPKEVDLSSIMLEGYFEYVQEENLEAFKEIVAVEVELEKVLEDGTHFLGKLDAVERDKRTGFLNVRDTKTVQSVKTPTWMLQIDEQLLGYNMLARSAYGEHVDGGTYSMIRKVKRTATAKPPFFARHDVRYNRLELESFEARLLETLADMRRRESRLVDHTDDLVGAARVAYPHPTRDCSWKCPFVNVCPMFNDGSRVADALAENYQKRDPLERYKLTHDEEVREHAT